MSPFVRATMPNEDCIKTSSTYFDTLLGVYKRRRKHCAAVRAP